MHPILFEYGPIAVRFYGLMYVVGIIFGIYILRSEVERKAIDLVDDDIVDLMIWTVLSGILGARLYYVAFEFNEYADNLWEIPAIWHGGLAIHGGIIGGFIFGVFFLKRKGVPFWPMADAAAPVLILGQAFGRFGNFMNGDAHGTPTDMPWGLVFPPESIAGTNYEGIPIHPTMVYEMLLNFAIFILLWFVLRKKDYRPGFLFAVYLGLYSAGRFVVEAFRGDSLMLGDLRVAQLVSVVIVIAAVSIIFKKRLWESGGADEDEIEGEVEGKIEGAGDEGSGV